MATLTRALSADGSVMAMAIDSTDIVTRIEEIHHTSAVMTAATGRLATAASMMGLLLKGEGDSLTLRLDGGGPAGTIIAVSDSEGCVKAYAQNPVVELPLNDKGKLDVSGAVGKSGYLSVIKDLGLKEPYSGQTPIVSGEIAEDTTRMKVSAPIFTSSSTAMAAEGPPIPVEVTLTFSPRRVPV